MRNEATAKLHIPTLEDGEACLDNIILTIRHNDIGYLVPFRDRYSARYAWQQIYCVAYEEYAGDLDVEIDDTVYHWEYDVWYSVGCVLDEWFINYFYELLQLDEDEDEEELWEILERRGIIDTSIGLDTSIEEIEIHLVNDSKIKGLFGLLKNPGYRKYMDSFMNMFKTRRKHA